MKPAVMRTMKEDEQAPVLDLLEAAFGMRDPFERYFEHDPLLGPQDTLLACIEDAPVSCVQIFSKQIRLRGSVLSLGGIGSVATHPEHRKRGIARELMKQALSEMRKRGMALSLLFAVIHEFYAPFGFAPIAGRRQMLGAMPESGPPLSADGARDMQPDELPVLRELYESYCAGFEASTVRDTAYWDGQLRYAGNPTEDFRVMERQGRPQAYARAIREGGACAVTEFARDPHIAQSASALAALLLSLAAPGEILVWPATADRPLERALQDAGVSIQAVSDPTPMWCVLDRPRLLELSGGPQGQNDGELLANLVGGPQTVYWPSDRF